MKSHVKRIMGCAIALLAVAVVGSLLAPAAQAVPVGYWRFEGTPGGSIGTDSNVLNPGTLDATGAGGAAYGASVIGMNILDPVSGIVRTNTSSMNMATGTAVVLDNAAIDAPTFTIEAFIRVPNQASFPSYVSHRNGGANLGWQLDIDPDEDARTRFDTAAQINQVAGSGPAQRLADDRWHHTAVTFNGTTITHYTDYGVIATRVLNGSAADATAVAADMIFGASSVGSVDEIRYSNSVLPSSQFLRSVNNALWRMEGTPGGAIGAVPNAFNPGTLDGAGEAGETYSGDVPDNGVFDPITGTTWANTSSLNLNSPGRVRVVDNDELDATAFTVEAFVKIGGDQGGFPSYISRLTANVSGWQLDIDAEEDARARIDTGGAAGEFNQVVGSGPAQSLADFEWHHVALTFDGNTARLYVDYANLATRNINGLKLNVNSVATDLLLGSGTLPVGSALDEIRYSASPLSPDLFLRTTHIIPEPASVMLLGLGGLALLRRRRAA